MGSLGFQHGRQRGLCGVEGRGQAHGNDGIPFVLGECVHGRHILNAHIVHLAPPCKSFQCIIMHMRQDRLSASRLVTAFRS